MSTEPTRSSYILSLVIAAGMASQAGLGLALSDQYRDSEWIRATWFGNDLVTLLLGVPMLIVGLLLARRGSPRGQLLWLGMLGYAVYNYAFYLFGAALNAFFPLYALLLLLPALVLGAGLSRIDLVEVAASFRPATPVRVTGGFLAFVAVGLASAWTAMWAGFVFAGRPTPVEPEAFKIVAALDLTMMVPALAFGGIWLWRRKPWGYVIASIASVQGALYLLVLSVNSGVAIARGLADAPGELPAWGGLCLATTTAAAVLLRNSEGGTSAPCP